MITLLKLQVYKNLPILVQKSRQDPLKHIR